MGWEVKLWHATRFEILSSIHALFGAFSISSSTLRHLSLVQTIISLQSARLAVNIIVLLLQLVSDFQIY